MPATRKAGISDEAIRVRAYHLWEAAGQPFGRDQEFWDTALIELTAAAKAKTAPKPRAPIAAKAKKPKIAATKPVGKIKASDAVAEAPAEKPAPKTVAKPTKTVKSAKATPAAPKVAAAKARTVVAKSEPAKAKASVKPKVKAAAKPKA